MLLGEQELLQQWVSTLSSIVETIDHHHQRHLKTGQSIDPQPSSAAGAGYVVLRERALTLGLTTGDDTTATALLVSEPTFITSRTVSSPIAAVAAGPPSSMSACV